MPPVYQKKLRNVKDLLKKSFLLVAKECGKGQSIGKVALLFILHKMTLCQYFNKKNFDQNVHLGMVLSVRLTLFFY